MFKLPKKESEIAKELCRLTVSYDGVYNVTAAAGVYEIQRPWLQKYYVEGSFPLESVLIMSEKIGATPWELSYIRLANVFGENRKTLESVIANASRIDKDTISRLLAELQ